MSPGRAVALVLALLLVLTGVTVSGRLDPGHSVEVDTPDAAFTIEHTGYYRVNRPFPGRPPEAGGRGVPPSGQAPSGRPAAPTPHQQPAGPPK